MALRVQFYVFLSVLTLAVASSRPDLDASCQMVFAFKPNVTAYHPDGSCSFGCKTNGNRILGMAMVISDGGKCSEGMSCLRTNCYDDNEITQCLSLAVKEQGTLSMIKEDLTDPCRPKCQGFFEVSFGSLVRADGTKCRLATRLGDLTLYGDGRCANGECILNESSRL